MLKKILHLIESYDHLLLEDKVDFITSKQGDKIWSAYEKDHLAKKLKLQTSEEIVKYLATNFSEKYLQKVTNWYIQGDFRLEDKSKIKDSIEVFEKHRNKLEKKDLNQYTSSSELDKAIEPYIDKPVEISNKQKERDYEANLFKKGYVEEFYKDSSLKILVPVMKDAAIHFGKGTRWCTSAKKDNAFEEYDDQGLLYIIIAKDGAKFQFHFETEQFMDASDDDINVTEVFKKYPSLYKAFKDIAEDRGLVDMLDPHNLNDDDILKSLAITKKSGNEQSIATWINENFDKIKSHNTKIEILTEFLKNIKADDYKPYMARALKPTLIKLTPIELVNLMFIEFEPRVNSISMSIASVIGISSIIAKDHNAMQTLVDRYVKEFKANKLGKSYKWAICLLDFQNNLQLVGSFNLSKYIDKDTLNAIITDAKRGKL